MSILGSPKLPLVVLLLLANITFVYCQVQQKKLFIENNNNKGLLSIFSHLNEDPYDQIEQLGLSLWLNVKEDFLSKMTNSLLTLYDEQKKECFKILAGISSKGKAQLLISSFENISSNFELNTNEWHQLWISLGNQDNLIYFTSSISSIIPSQTLNLKTSLKISYLRGNHQIVKEIILFYCYSRIMKEDKIYQQAFQIAHSKSSLNRYLRKQNTINQIDTYISDQLQMINSNQKSNKQTDLNIVTSYLKFHNKRNLQTVNYLQGNSMISLLRFEHDSKVEMSFQYNLNNLDGLFIGYFKIDIIESNKVYPLITLGTLKLQRIFLNLVFTSNNSIELRYFNFENSTGTKIQQQLPFDATNKWVALGFSFRYSHIYLVYSDPDTSQISFSQPSTITGSSEEIQLICIACSIGYSNYAQFKGKISTVKFLRSADSSPNSDYSFFKEDNVKQQQFLNDDSIKNNFIGTEYDLNQGFSCTSGYYFQEGVCTQYGFLLVNIFSAFYEHSSFENRKFIYWNPYYEPCESNCENCAYTTCTVCRVGYGLVNNNCERCDLTNLCSTTCTGIQVFDKMNKYCVDSFNMINHSTNPILLSSRLFTEETDVQIISNPQVDISYSFIHCYIDPEKNFWTLLSFLGGNQFKQYTLLKRSFADLPKGYKKTVQLYLLFASNGDPNSITIKANQQIMQLNPNFKHISVNKQQCPFSNSTSQSIYSAEFTITNSDTSLELEIGSSVDFWAVRNINVIVSKCHPTCDTCSGGGISDCISCPSYLEQNRFTCNCQVGQYQSYNPKCYDGGCTTCLNCTVLNCAKCEDFSGQCSECDLGYVKSPTGCILEIDCDKGDQFGVSSYKVFKKNCVITKNMQLDYLDHSSTLYQNGEYWKYPSSQSYIEIFKCGNIKMLKPIGNGEYYSYQTKIVDYLSFNYKIQVMVRYQVYGNMSPGDNVNIVINGQSYTYDYNGSFLNCIVSGTENTPVIQSYDITPSDDNFFFQFTSNSSGLVNNKSFALKNVLLYYVRCDPVCLSCTDSTKQSCGTCIENAEFDSSINTCKCKDGFTFVYVYSPTDGKSPGRCLPCHPDCKTCSGTSFQECESCYPQFGWYSDTKTCKYLSCPTGQFLNSSNICQNCHGCCKSCTSFEFNSCTDCFVNYSLNNSNDNICYHNSNLACSISCSIQVNNYCGGSQLLHNQCLLDSWVPIDQGLCIKCDTFVNGECGGQYQQQIIDLCKERGFIFPIQNKCYSCKDVNSQGCGRDEIKGSCKQKKWYKLDSTQCIDCDASSPTISQCICHTSCKTCFILNDQQGCTSCTPPLALYSQQCIQPCPQDFSVDTIKNECVPTCSLVSNSICGGSLACESNGWEIKNANYCVFCGNYSSNTCSGDLPQEDFNVCKPKGFQKYTNSQKCTSCKIAYGSQCGDSEIANTCKNKNWVKFNQSYCLDCDQNSSVYSQCLCDPSCETCDQFFSPTSCTKCPSHLVFYQKQCLLKCPNGFIKQGQNCVQCTDIQMPNCFSCFRTCQMCNPNEDITNSNSCLSCSTTRYLDNCKCLCKDVDQEDTRHIFFECSYLNTAVLEPVLSNSIAQLSINFGKQLNPPSSYQLDIPSQLLCNVIFNEQTVQLFGTNYTCLISQTKIIIDFDKNEANIFDGDLIYLNDNVLTFKSSPNTQINRFFNNVVVQDKILGISKVVFNYITNPNYCNDISLEFIKLLNSAERGFKELKWSIIQHPDVGNEDYLILETFLNKINEIQQPTLNMPKGLIKPNVKIVLRFDYSLKANVISYEDFPIEVKVEKIIQLQTISTITVPFYRYHKGIISIITSVIQCDPNGITYFKEAINFQVDSIEYPKFNYNNSSYQQTEYLIQITPFTLPSQNINLNIKGALLSNQFITSQITFKIEVLQSILSAKISGQNGYYNYHKKIVIVGRVKDPDIPTEDETKDIDISWKCSDLTTSNSCLSKLGESVQFPPQKNEIEIPANTFNPYTAIKVELLGKKTDGRSATDVVIIMLSEFDLPPLDVQLQIMDLQTNTVNLNEEIYATLHYNTQINVDLLSFSGTIMYENEVVGIIKFDYFTLRFQIWNYYSNFSRQNKQFQIRFNIFNPFYYMPSISLIPLNINFPPDKCQFIINQPLGQGYSLESQYTLMMESCSDENSPISYQFFFYNTANDFEREKKYPNQVKRRQITDKQYSNGISINLPSGKLLLMAQAIDSKQAIYNTTIAIEVQQKKYDESSYLKLIESKLQISNSLSIESEIYELAILSEDIPLRSEFKNSLVLNSKKIEIQNKLINLSNLLPTLSTFQTLVDKALSSLNESGIIYTTSQSQSFLDKQIAELDILYNTQIQSTKIEKERFEQKMFDSFLVVNSFYSPETKDKVSQSKVIQLQENISKYLLKNALPNEDSIVFKGSSASIMSRKVTEKYVCSYFSCPLSSEDNKDNLKPPTIYNIKSLTMNENFYVDETSYKNYTDSLKLKSPNLAITTYPVITPSIHYENEEPVTSFKNQVALTFEAQGNNTQSMACLSKNDEKWNNSNCKNLFNSRTQIYTCHCDRLYPTTVIEDIESLFSNSNLGVAFGEDGLTNITTFEDFYEYVAFWLLFTTTGAFIFLYFKGKTLDSSIKNNNSPKEEKFKSQIINKNQVAPLILAFEKKQIFSSQQDQKSLEADRLDSGSRSDNKLYNLNQSIKPNKLKEITIHPHKKNEIKQETPKSKSAIIKSIEEISKEKPQQQSSGFDLQSQQGLKEEIPTNQDIQQNCIIQNLNDQPDIVVKESMVIDLSPYQSRQQGNQIQQLKLLTDNHDDQSLKFKQPIVNHSNLKIIKTKSPLQLKETNNQDKNSLQDENKNINNQNDGETKEIMQEYQKKYETKKWYLRILLFHDLFSIFYLYNSELPRSLRFLIFYIRLVHSMAISVVFDKKYNPSQKIALALINALTLVIVVKICELVFKSKSRIGKILGRLIMGGLLIFYYYLILSIVSGQSSSESNTFIGVYSLILGIDIFLIQFISASIMQYFAGVLLAVKHLQTEIKCIKLFSNIINLKLIIDHFK